MKRAIFIGLHVVLLLAADVVGTLIQPLHLQQTLEHSTGVPLTHGKLTRTHISTFTWDGIVVMLAVYVLALLFAIVRSRTLKGALDITLALVVATILGLWAAFG